MVAYLWKNVYCLPIHASLLLLGCQPFNTDEKYTYCRSLREVNRNASELFGTPQTRRRLKDTTLSGLIYEPNHRISSKYFLPISWDVFWFSKDFVLGQIAWDFQALLSDFLRMLRDFLEFVRVFKDYWVFFFLFRAGLFFGRRGVYKYFQRKSCTKKMLLF